ncbi:MAG TPA: YceI family protein [Thermoanaerobaculia bacterium]|nr:YceI family protein [Thermoanaerobaculia bacterium]
MKTENDSGIAHRVLSSIAAVSSCLAVAISLAAAQPAPPAASFSLAPGSRLSLEGQSTLHAYSSTATQVEATAEFDGTFAAGSADARAAVAAGALKSLRVAVPVAGLKSGEGGLDKNMQKALKQDTSPVIRFTLVDYKAEEAKDGSLLVKAHGRLSVAGVEKETVVEATCRFGPGGVEVSGAKDVLMSDFGIKPPVMMLGTIKTADKVVVRFALKLKAPEPAAANKN